MPRIRLLRWIPALLLLAAVYVALRRNSSEISLKNDTEIVKKEDLVEELVNAEVDGHVEGQFERRIVAVGDLHGDYPNALKVLQMSNVVDAQGNWTGDVDIFVQTGDIIDRCARHLSAIRNINLRSL